MEERGSGVWYIAADIGGSKTRFGAIAQNGEGKWGFLQEPIVLDTPSDPAEFVSVVRDTLKKFGGAPKGFIGGIAGRVVGPQRRLALAPRLSPRWHGVSLVELAEEWVGAPVRSWWFNDTALVGLGEMHYGAGETSGIAAYITISTGVGGCRFIDGAIDTHEGSFEPGHIIIDAGGALCADCPPCPLDGLVDWEATVSGSALAARFGKPPYTIAQEDPLWNRLAEYSAVALRNIALLWTPQCIVLGGSMVVGDPAIPLEPIRAELKKHPLTKGIDIRKAACGALGGLYGAMRVAQLVGRHE